MTPEESRRADLEARVDELAEMYARVARAPDMTNDEKAAEMSRLTGRILAHDREINWIASGT